jgi:hypothetical protein
MMNWKRNPGLPVKRLPKNDEVHEIMTPELRELLKEREQRAVAS